MTVNKYFTTELLKFLRACASWPAAFFPEHARSLLNGYTISMLFKGFFPEYTRSLGQIYQLIINEFRSMPVHFSFLSYLCFCNDKNEDDMAGKITPMSKIKQVLLLHKDGLSNRDIAKKLMLNKCTVNEYVRKINRDPLGIDELLKLDDPVLEGHLFAGNPAYSDHRMEVFLKELPYFKEQLKIPHVTRQLLWEEYRKKHLDGYGKSQFFFHLKQNLVVEQTPVAVLTNRYKPGKELFVDFAGDTLSYNDMTTGEKVDVQVFIATLPYTDYAYVLCIESQRVEDFIYCIKKCLEYLGGVPKIIVSDNLKSAVIQPDRYEPKLNKAFADMGNHYQFAIIPARSIHPTDKALVESQVSRVYHRIYAKLRNRQFYSLKELNDAITPLLLEYNQTRMQQRPYSREEHFHTAEKPALQPLPDKDFELKYYAQMRIRETGEIYLSCDKHYYTVPYTLIGRRADIIYTRSLVKVYVDNKCVAAIPRDRTQGAHTQIPDFLAPNVKAYLDRSPESYCEKAKRVSESLENLFKAMFYSKANGVVADVYYRSCEKMLSIQKRTDINIFNKACDICRVNNIFRGDGLESVIAAISKTNFDEESELASVTPTNHENTRGSEQFK